MSEDLKKFANKNAKANINAPAVVDVGGRVSHSTGAFQRFGTGSVGGMGGATVTRTVARPYHPLFSSPDRLQLPVQLAQLNQYWRLFYQLDPVIGGVVDMHSQMPWSSAYLRMDERGEDSVEILHAYEDMMNETELLSWLPRLTQEYFIIGEVFPFTFWDDKEGIWSHITLHNPDYVEVVDSPLIDDDPILTLRPSQEFRRVLQSTDPRYVRLRQKMPPEMLALLSGGKNLPLSSLNASHVARKAFPYDIRGTSILGRMFRILMYEDAVFNGQIQQAQRHALPLRVFKLGDPNSNWLPTPQNQEDFAQLLAEAEVDPLSALIYHYGLQVEYHGMEGKQLKINQEWDIIERAKLVALGVSKAFLHGEVTYASANAGLQVLMMRYRTFRDMILSDWIYKKVFATMAEMRQFYRDTKKTDPEYGLPESRDPQLEKKTMILNERMQKIASLTDPQERNYEIVKLQPLIDEIQYGKYSRYIPMHKIAGADRSRVRKKKHLLYPNLQFEKRLDVRQDSEILSFWADLASKGWISPRSVVQGAGLDYDSEQSSISSDAGQLARNQMIMQSLGGEEGGGKGVPMGGLGIGGGGGVGSIAPGAFGEGEEAGEGAGAPGAGPGPAPAVAHEQIQKIADVHVRKEIEEILSSNEKDPDLFVGNKK